MKRFITISLLAALWLPTMACLWIQTNNSYLFSPLDKQEFRRRVETTCNDNWKAYLQSDKEYYWFDADEAVKTARSKNDLLMVSYIQNLQKYLACAEEKQQERWEYPTKEELDKLSTCDMNAVINNGLSDDSKEALKDRRGEDIVNADVAEQGYETTKAETDKTIDIN
jgi:hypothetical protein